MPSVVDFLLKSNNAMVLRRQRNEDTSEIHPKLIGELLMPVDIGNSFNILETTVSK